MGNGKARISPSSRDGAQQRPAAHRSAIFRPLSAPAYTALTENAASSPSSSSSSSVRPSSAKTIVRANGAEGTSVCSPTLSLSSGAKGLPDLMQRKESESYSPLFPWNMANDSYEVGNNRNMGGAGVVIGRDDLGDDDSFTPEIVSGYHFNLPLALDHHFPLQQQSAIVQSSSSSQIANVPTTITSSTTNTPSTTTRTNTATTTTTTTNSVGSSSSPPRRTANRSSGDALAHAVNTSRLLDDDLDDYDSPGNEPRDDFIDAGRRGLNRDDDSDLEQNDHLNHYNIDMATYSGHPDKNVEQVSPTSGTGRLRDVDHRTDAIYDDLDDIGDWIASGVPKPGTDFSKQINRSKVGKVSGACHATALATAALHTHQRSDDRRRDNMARDKLDRATVEQVLDPRTRMILFRLLSRNRLRTLDGCVSTGKEANVYYATAAALPGVGPDSNGIYPPNPGLTADDSAPDSPVAVKVFKTSILQFKDRERYVAGEFRFRRAGYQRSSNRKMVQQWAEKEFRNQMRLQEAGVPAPIPLLLKPPVLIMSFFGKDGWPAPRLKDASLSPARLTKAYFSVCMLMRRMFRVARLVHGDLSEYNMLYWNGDVVIIDVSQSVEDDHPMALDFLRRDCANVNDFFRRSGVMAVLGVRELFDFVVGEHIGSSKEEQESTLTLLIENADSRSLEAISHIHQDDEVFMRSYIPRTLHDVEVRDSHMRSKGGEEIDSSLFARLTGLSLTQKRERLGSNSKVVLFPESGLISAPEAVAPRSAVTFGDGCNSLDPEAGGAGSPTVEAGFMEPTTFRQPSLSDKPHHQIGTSSPCTSNSSSRHVMEEREVRKLARNDGSWEGDDDDYDERHDDVGLTGSHLEKLNHRTSGSHDDDNVESDSSSSEGWEKNHEQRRQPSGSSDPLSGLSKKEWKKKVKAEAREKREHKVPKHVKKRKEALAKRRRGLK